MKRVLVLYYSQSGQLETVLKHVMTPLQEAEDVDVDVHKIEPQRPFAFPWSFYRFFGVMPESVMMEGCAVKPLELQEAYDLIILGYTPWFLSPSLPVAGFLQSEHAKKLFGHSKVITVITCRDMWLMAQEKVKKLLASYNATLLDNVVLTDQGESVYSFITTPRWMLTGKKNPFWFFPPAGVAPEAMVRASRFGARVVDALRKDEEKEKTPLFKHMGAVRVDKKFIAGEKIGHRSFMVWSRILKASGPQNSLRRNIVITLYCFFLVAAILVIMPLSIIIRKIAYPFRKEAIEKEIAYFESPSGR